MKKLTLFLILLIVASCKNNKEFSKTPLIPSGIDKLQSEAGIEKFIQESDTNYRKYELKSLQDFNRPYRDSLNKILARKLKVDTKYEKADFDNNGYTDILAIGDDHTCYGDGNTSCSFSPVVVMNYGKNRPKIIPISVEWGQALVPKVETIHSQPILAVYQYKYDWRKKSYSESRTALTFKFGNFIEFNEHPKENKITQIEFSTSGCFGTCPVYKLTLNRDSISVFHARFFNFSDNREISYDKEEGVFYTTITKRKFEELEKILNYIDFENLNKVYSVSHTDDQTGDLKITFNNGKVKTISDYGMVGSYGLTILYKKLAELRFSEKWNKK